jgi:hypothetical protein
MDYETNWETYRDDALNSFKDEYETICQSFEHHLNDDSLADTGFYIFREIVNGLDELIELSFDYIYRYDDDGGSGLIEYDFRDELAELILDRFGWSIFQGVE